MDHRPGGPTLEWQLATRRRNFQPGDAVIYRKGKHSTAPGPRAQGVVPAPRGETYSYMVDKLWTVVSASGEELTLRTRRGKEHVVRADDPNLRRPNLWERLRYRDRFPDYEA